MNRLRAGWSGVGIPTETKYISRLRTSKSAPRPAKPPIRWVTGALSAGINRQGRKADHSQPLSDDVGKKREWSCTSFPPVCLHGVYEDNLNFTFLELQLCCAGTPRNLKQFCLQKKQRIPDKAVWLQTEISAYLRHQSMSNNPCSLVWDLCAQQQQANISHNASPSYHKNKVRQNRQLGYKSGLDEKWGPYK